MSPREKYQQQIPNSVWQNQHTTTLLPQNHKNLEQPHQCCCRLLYLGLLQEEVQMSSCTYSTAHTILQEDTFSCLQLETQAQPQLNTQMHALARPNQLTLISTFTTGLCPPLVVISITPCDADKNK